MLEGLEDLAATYSPTSWDAVPLAQRVFTAEFGKGSGVEPLAMTTRSSKPTVSAAALAGPLLGVWRVLWWGSELRGAVGVLDRGLAMFRTLWFALLGLSFEVELLVWAGQRGLLALRAVFGDGLRSSRSSD